jgi:hypothetical protein
LTFVLYSTILYRTKFVRMQNNGIGGLNEEFFHFHVYFSWCIRINGC